MTRTTLRKQLLLFVPEVDVEANSSYNEERRSFWREDLLIG
jgi:hypothetical protein